MEYYRKLQEVFKLAIILEFFSWYASYLLCWSLCKQFLIKRI